MVILLKLLCRDNDNMSSLNPENSLKSENVQTIIDLTAFFVDRFHNPDSKIHNDIVRRLHIINLITIYIFSYML